MSSLFPELEMFRSSSSQVGLYFVPFPLPPFPSSLGAVSRYSSPRTRCCRRWQVRSCLFLAVGIQHWSSWRSWGGRVAPANPTRSEPQPRAGSCPAVAELLNLPPRCAERPLGWGRQGGLPLLAPAGFGAGLAQKRLPAARSPVEGGSGCLPSIPCPLKPAQLTEMAGG